LSNQVDTVFLTLGLEESKSFSSIRSTNAVRQHVIDRGFSFDKGGFLDHRKNTSSQNNVRFGKLTTEVNRRLIDSVERFKAKELSFTKMTREVKALMREAYYEAYQMGFDSSGASLVHGTALTKLVRQDATYIESAHRHEMRYLNTLLNQIRDGRVRGDTEDRLAAYSESMKHIYYSGRILGSPSDMIIDWIAPLDRNTCVSCRFLSEHSPYTRDVLPTTPRSGDTRCLNRCRCRIVMRSVNEATLKEIKAAHYSKGFYTRTLEQLKS
jgi:hypothetical protein